MIYSETFEIKKDSLKHYNELLQLDLDDCLPYYNEHDIERLGAKKDDYIPIGFVKFNNGNYVTIDIASGSSNYYDNIVLYDKNGNELICSDCTYELSGFSLYYGEDTYNVEIKEV